MEQEEKEIRDKVLNKIKSLEEKLGEGLIPFCKFVSSGLRTEEYSTLEEFTRFEGSRYIEENYVGTSFLPKNEQQLSVFERLCAFGYLELKNFCGDKSYWLTKKAHALFEY